MSQPPDLRPNTPPPAIQNILCKTFTSQIRMMNTKFWLILAVTFFKKPRVRNNILVWAHNWGIWGWSPNRCVLIRARAMAVNTQQAFFTVVVAHTWCVRIQQQDNDCISNTRSTKKADATALRGDWGWQFLYLVYFLGPNKYASPN